MATYFGRQRDRWWRGPSVLAIALLALAAPVLAGGCGRAGQASAQQDQQAAKPSPSAVRPAFDPELDGAARILGGLQPEDGDRFARVTGSREWQAYQAEFERTWKQAEEGRFSAMRKWRDAEIGGDAAACGTLFYPFAGPDILNAYLLFPNCKRYVLFGLEPLGSLPALETLSPGRLEQLFADVRGAASDIFERNYFITSRMSTDLQKSDLRGNLPLMLLFLERLDARILSVTRWDIASDGSLVPPPGAAPGATVDQTPSAGSGAPVPQASSAATAAPPSAGAGGDVLLLRPKRVPAVRIIVVTPDGRKQEILYFRGFVEDAALGEQRGVVRYLEGLTPYITFIKSASYLFHDPTFSTMKRLVLSGSALIVQDDTGVPYRYLKSTDWDLRLYGRYAKPVKDFKFGYQPDLDAAYAQPGLARPLSFSFGYHWRDGASAVIVAVRRRAT